MSEHTEQVKLVSWFKRQYPHYAECIIAIPNGAHIAGSHLARAIKVKKMKDAGMKSGASDLFIAVPNDQKHGLWIEMKDAGKTQCSVSDEQQKHLDCMKVMGYEAEWCPGFESAKSVVINYLGDKNE